MEPLRPVVTWVSLFVTVLGIPLTVFLFATHDPDDGANIGGSAAMFGSAFSLLALVVSLAGRNRSGTTRDVTTGVGLLLLAAGIFCLSIVRPFE